MTNDTPRPNAEPGLGLRYGGPRQRRPPMRTITTPLAAAICAGLLAAACSSGDAPPPPPAVLHPRTTTTTTTTTEPPTPPTTVPEAPLPPSRPAPTPPEDVVPPEDECHPAYGRCLMLLEGDALDCDDIARDRWPVPILNPADDPYRLGDGTSELGCRPHIENPAPEPERDTPPAPAPQPTDHSEEPAPTPDTTQADHADDPTDSDEPAPEVPTTQPVYVPTDDTGPATPPPVGTISDPTPATADAPEQPVPAPPEDDAPATATTIPPTPEPEPEPEPGPANIEDADAEPIEDADDYADVSTEDSTAEPIEDADDILPDVSTEVPCVDVPTHDGERWCTPPPVGDTIQLFSAWQPPGSHRSVSRCGSPGYDDEPYYDSGRTHDEQSRVCRTLPLTLRVGTVIEDYDTGGREYQVHRVTGIGGEPWERLPLWTDVVYPIYLCSRWWGIFDGYEDRGFLPAMRTRETLYVAWRDADGRWRLQLGAGRIIVGEDC